MVDNKSNISLLTKVILDSDELFYNEAIMSVTTICDGIVFLTSNMHSFSGVVEIGLSAHLINNPMPITFKSLVEDVISKINISKDYINIRLNA